jgi:YggT family protein
MALIAALIHGVLWGYLAILTVRMMLSLLPLLVRQWEPRGVLLVIAEFTYTVTDPPLRFLRRFLPSPRLGDIAIDLPFIVAYLGLSLLLRWLPF